MPGTRAWVTGADGQELPPGQVGELLVRGPHVILGYWGHPAQTGRKLDVRGVLHTGDLFRRDSDGRLSFVARSDDVISTRGEQVAPAEVEHVLCAAPGFREAVVVGVPDDRCGARVVAHVCALPGHALDALALRRHCAEQLERFKVPSDVLVHRELPRLGSGKVDRLALVRRAAG